jgi:hypothetical protein
MAYYIFLKSLRSLEEFRKNLRVKIPPKSPSTNFQSLDKFKNPILIQKFLFSDFRPGRPHGPLGLWPSPPAAPSPQAEIARPTHPPRASIAYSWEIRFPIRFTPSRAGRLPVISLTTGPRLLAPSPTFSRSSSPAPPPSAAQLRASGAIEPLPPRLHFPSLSSPP